MNNKKPEKGELCVVILSDGRETTATYKPFDNLGISWLIDLPDGELFAKVKKWRRFTDEDSRDYPEASRFQAI